MRWASGTSLSRLGCTWQLVRRSARVIGLFGVLLDSRDSAGSDGFCDRFGLVSISALCVASCVSVLRSRQCCHWPLLWFLASVAMDGIDLRQRMGISQEDFDALELSGEVCALRASCRCCLCQELDRLRKYLASGRVSRKIAGQPDPQREVDPKALARLLRVDKKVRAAILLEQEIFRNCSLRTGALVCCCSSWLVSARQRGSES